MIIGIDIRSLSGKERTGVGEYAYEIVSALLTHHKEHEYVLFSNSFSDSVDTKEWNGPQVTVVQTKLPNKLLHLLLSFRILSIDGFLKRKTGKRIDYLFSPNLHFTHVRRATQVLMVHDLSFLLYKECYSWIDRLWHILVQPKKQLRRAILLAPSEQTKQDIQFVLDDAKKEVTVIPHGVSSLFFEEIADEVRREVKEQYELPKNYLLMLGTIEPRKNIQHAITAFGKSRLALDGYELLIAGGTGYKAKQVIQAAKKMAGVRLLGYVPAAHKAVLLYEATGLVYPSLYEGFGLPIIEAYAVGTPVLTSNRSAMPEVSDGNAVLVNPDSSDDIAAGMLELITKEQRKTQQHAHHWDVAADTLNRLFV